MAVNLVRFNLELQGNQDVTLNGLDIRRLDFPFEAMVDLKLIEKQLTEEQLYNALCELRKVVCALVAVRQNRMDAARKDFFFADGDYPTLPPVKPNA